MAGQTQSLVKSVVPQIVSSAYANRLEEDKANRMRQQERERWAGKPIPDAQKKFLPPGLNDMGDVYDLFGSGEAYQRFIGNVITMETQGENRAAREEALALREYNDMLIDVRERGIPMVEWEAMPPDERKFMGMLGKYPITDDILNQLNLMSSKLGISLPPSFGVIRGGGAGPGAGSPTPVGDILGDDVTTPSTNIGDIVTLLGKALEGASVTGVPSLTTAGTIFNEGLASGVGAPGRAITGINAGIGTDIGDWLTGKYNEHRRNAAVQGTGYTSWSIPEDTLDKLNRAGLSIRAFQRNVSGRD